MTINKHYTIIALAALLGTNILFSETTEKNRNSPAEKARQHAINIEKKYKVKVADQEFLDSIKKNGTQDSPEKSTKAPSLTSEEIRKIAFSLIPEEDDESEEIIDDKVVEKLLLMGSSDQRDFFLKTLFNGHISTGFGATQAMLTLSNPTTNLSTIRNRQQAISILAQDKSLIELIVKELNHIGDAEKKSLLPFQTEKRILEEDKNLPQIPDILPTEWNKSPGVIDAVEIGQLAIDGLFFPIDIYIAATGFSQYKEAMFSQQSKRELIEKITPGINAWMSGVIGTCRRYNRIKKKINDTQTCNQPRDMLLETKKHILALQTLSSLINQNQELLTQIPSLQPLAHFNNQEKHSPDLKNLLYILNNYDFEGENSFFYRQGPAIAAYNILKDIKGELVPVFAATGALDMYVALAKLYEKNEQKQTQYCIPSFVENSSTPLLDAHNFWNPYIPADQAVTNSITFNESNPNAVITGANTGGKSTTMKALMLNALMAQSFGIAPSESLKLTPFSKMACLMNASDNIADQTSLFKAEAMNANECLSKAESLQDNEFGLFSFDEIFTGTSPEVGERATRLYAEKIAQQKNAIILLATHYKDIANKKKNPKSRYNNFHMELKTDGNGTLERTYKLKEGESSVNIAFEIIKETGLNIEPEKKEESEPNLTPLFFR